MWLRTSCTFSFDIVEPTTFIFMLKPQNSNAQLIKSEEFKVKPNIQITQFRDIYGNLCQKLIAPSGKFEIKSKVKVKLKNNNSSYTQFIQIQDLPQDVLLYLLPSRYCQSDCFNLMAGEITQGIFSGYEQVLAIVNWVQENIMYENNCSDIQVSAIEVNNRQFGVCRDFAHLAIALCRSINIPARIVVGYLYELEPMDLHAWFEVYLGNSWHRFDATQKEKKNGYVVIAYGRDAADVAVYNQYGPTLFPTFQKVKVKSLNN